jgi:hypothetical protein
MTEGTSPSTAKTLQTEIIDRISTDVGGVFDVIERPDASIGLCLNMQWKGNFKEATTLAGGCRGVIAPSLTHISVMARVGYFTLRVCCWKNGLYPTHPYSGIGQNRLRGNFG